MAKILMVDDEPDAELLFRQNFRREIRKKQLEFLFAQSGEQALETLDSDADAEIVMLLSDINMPGMSGLELLDEVRQQKPGLPVIMITAYGDQRTREDAQNRGAQSLISKPVDFNSLRPALIEVANQALE